EYGLTNAAEIGIACATFGLVMGGLIGGPIAKFLITRNKLQPKEGKPLTVGIEHEQENIQIDYNKALNTIFVIFFTAGVGIMFRDLLALAGLQLPLFVTSLFGGIVVTNLIPVLFKKIKWNPEASNSLAMAADLSLGLFLAMSLMSLQLWSVVDLAGTLIFIVIAQVTVITVFVILVVFWLMGRDYDAAVMSAGYSGLALGATPTAIANMTAVTQKFGGAPRAFIVVPLVGAFFIDIANALIIKYLLSLFG
ncbi:MAG: sodium/glutamate symporter, partial [Bacteroidota bacterium]